MYKLINNPKTGKLTSIEIKGERTYIPLDVKNVDYQAYLKWVEEGNTADPAD